MTGILERRPGRAEESPLTDSAARSWATWTAPDSGAAGARVRMDAVVPGKAARRVLVAMAEDLRKWDLEARTERAYREPGGTGPDLVRVTASGWADASAWRLRGGLSGLSPRGFAQGGHGDGMEPGPLLGVLLEQAVAGSPRSGSAAGVPAAGVKPAWRAAMDPAPGRPGEPGGDAAVAAASATAGAAALAGIPGVPGADGVRSLTGDELLGAISAARRQANRNEWLELAATAEFARRRYAETQAAMERGVRPGQRPGEFFCEEVSWATTRSARVAEERVELAVAMAVRLPDLGARMAEGALDSGRLQVVHRATADLSVGSARLVSAALAPDAPGLTPEALGKRAWRLTLKLEPEAAVRRKKRGKKKRRVELWMEESGNAGLAGRELDPEDALAASAYYDAVARMLRTAGVPGTLRELRHLAFVDRNTGKDPLGRIKGIGDEPTIPGRPDGSHDSDADAPGASGPDGSDAGQDEWRPGDPRDDGYRDDEPPNGPDGLDDGEAGDDGSDDDGADGSGGPDDGHGGSGDGPGPAGTGGPSRGAAAPAGPALNIHLLVSAGTVLGWSNEPGEVSRFGFMDAPSTRDLIRAGARNPATRWHVTLVDESGQAVAHACARGPRPWTGPRPGGRRGEGDEKETGPPEQVEQTAQVSELLNRLGITKFAPIARGGCDHRHREDRYTPSRGLGDLVRARSATCPAPGCGARAVHNDLDHTIAWPGGPGTCECNLGPPCRHHHRMKQAPGWHLDQPQPGLMRWTTPSGRVYETRPTVYYP